MGNRTLSLAQIKQLPPITLAKALASPTFFDADTVKRLRSFAKALGGPDDTLEPGNPDAAGDLASDVDPAAAAPEDTGVDMGDLGADMGDLGDMTDTSSDLPPDVMDAGGAVKPGAQFLMDFHANMASLVDTANQKIAEIENPDVADGAKPILDQLRTSLTELEGLFSSIYPDQSPLSSGFTDSGEPATGDGEGGVPDLAKSWLAQKRPQYQLIGLATRLSGLAAAGGLNAKAKACVQGTVRDLHLITAHAKSFKPTLAKDVVPKAQYDELQQKYDRVAKKSTQAIDTLKRQLKEARGEAADLPT